MKIICLLRFTVIQTKTIEQDITSKFARSKKCIQNVLKHNIGKVRNKTRTIFCCSILEYTPVDNEVIYKWTCSLFIKQSWL